MFDHVPASLRNGIGFVALAIVGWGWWTYSGPYAWLAEAQLALFGAYVPTLTFLFGALLLMIPPIVVLGVLYQGRAARGEGQAEWEVRFTEGMALPQVRIGLLGAGFVLFALWNAYAWFTAGPLTPVDVDTIVRGAAPHYVRVPLETADVDAAVGSTSGMTTQRYVPLVQEGQPLAVFVAVKSSGDDVDLGDGVGLIAATGLPGDVAVAYEGLLADRTWVVDLEDSPDERGMMSLVFAGLGGAALIGAAITHVVRGRRT